MTPLYSRYARKNIPLVGDSPRVFARFFVLGRGCCSGESFRAMLSKLRTIARWGCGMGIPIPFYH